MKRRLIVSKNSLIVYGTVERFGIVPIEINLFIEDSTNWGLSIYNIKNNAFPSEDPT